MEHNLGWDGEFVLRETVHVGRDAETEEIALSAAALETLASMVEQNGMYRLRVGGSGVETSIPAVRADSFQFYP